MLSLITAMKDLPLEQLLSIYQDSLSDKNQQHVAQWDFLEYLREDFFPSGGIYALWKEDNTYTSAVRILPWKDGVLLAGLETAPELRRRGCARSLVQAVCANLLEAGSSPIYAHIAKRNHPSRMLHQSCGFSVISDTGTLLDGTVSSKYITVVYNG